MAALGLYELFVDERIKVPHWLEIHSIDDLKSKVISNPIASRLLILPKSGDGRALVPTINLA
jgi:uncharacterized membrane protein YqhA